ncbi:ChbG/HpnK family deacetylase [Georgenia subflava]|uniref:ChbG/HpnK family deacetylase n=1 Tax=Georgenia subflava TaxID=1622177 RepID=A0A6N7ENR1_9MICO|nr:ChbG/HpnK family deacetylase [Georgenia subflava]MPV37776.1 ChbG/HpnK family deacetylase [Georgenia subflava]
MSRRLVVTADDLGMDAHANEEIVDLLGRGVLTSTTLMTVAPGAADAAARVRAAGLAAPRLHVTLTSARELGPWRPLAADVPTLTDARGRFHVDPGRLAGRASVAEVAREMTAQLAWMHATGLRPGALDSHSGSLYGSRGESMMNTAMTFCAENGLGFRLPRRLPRVLDLGIRGRLRRRYDAGLAAADAHGVPLPQTMIGCWLPGRLIAGYAHLRANVLRKLRDLPDGVSELILHPAPAASVHSLDRAEGRKRVWELRLLRDPLFLRTIRREGISLVPAW